MTPPSTPPPLPEQRPKLSRIARAGLILSGLLFLTSLGLPAILCDGHEPVTGASVLAAGWMAPFVRGPLAWYANPLYLAAIVFTLLRKPAVALAFTVPAIGLALTSPQAHTWYFNESTGTPITSLGSAYPVWLSAIATLALTSAATLLTKRRK